jgi:hypothetical protein
MVKLKPSCPLFKRISMRYQEHLRARLSFVASLFRDYIYEFRIQNILYQPFNTIEMGVDLNITLALFGKRKI